MTLSFINKISKKLNKYLLAILCLCMSIFFLSCKKIIDTPDDEYAKLETEEAVIKSLNGAYAKLGYALSMNNLLSVKSDDINPQIQVGGWVDNGHKPVQSSLYNKNDPHINHWVPNFHDISLNGVWLYEECACISDYQDLSLEFYRTMYTAILMTNKIIHDLGVDEIDDTWKVYLGEAYFLRAYLYYKLVRVFGRLPLVTDIYVNYELPLARFIDIYKHIESDLITAGSYLPESKCRSRKGAQTPHQGTAKALLSEVYLTMGGYPVNDPTYYTKAAETAKEVINNANVYGFGLMDDYASLWQWQHHDNEESIWSIYYRGETFNPEDAGSYGEDYGLYPLPKIDKVSTQKYYLRTFPNSYRKEISFWHYMYVDRINVFNSLDNIYSGTNSNNFIDFEDVTFNESKDFQCNVMGKKQVVNFSCYSDNIIKTMYPPYAAIVARHAFSIARNPDSISNLENTINYFNILDNTEVEPGYVQFFHIFRYAHTLLTYAEASARSGNPDALAYEAANMVRRRAYKLPVNSPSVYDIPQVLPASAFADSVVKERGWEFCQEFEGRWNDIIRLQLLPQVEANNEVGGPFSTAPPWNNIYDENGYFIPLPEEDVWLNPYLDQTANDSIF